jgi:hypothetical protein
MTLKVFRKAIIAMGRPRILRLTLLDNDNEIASFYSGGHQKMEHALDEISYKVNKNKTPAANKNIATSGADNTQHQQL